MDGSDWKQALWRLLDSSAVQRFGRRLAISTTLLGLAATRTADAGPGLQLPVNPVMLPEAEVRKLGGKYVLKRSRARGLSVHFAGHQSHSSHSSHRSHASHYSSSHSSAAAPQPATPAPAPPAPPAPVVPPPPHKPTTIVADDFTTAITSYAIWTRGVLITAPTTHDEKVDGMVDGGQLVVKPRSSVAGMHFGGFVSKGTFDLRSERVSIELRRAASGAAVTIFGAGQDANNWLGFRIAGGKLHCETHVDGRVSAKELAYNPESHRWLRLRPGSVAAVVVWETSANGVNWLPEFVATPEIPISSLHVALSAGTSRAVNVPGSAVFDNFLVEKP